MKIILLQDVPKLGRKYEVKEVSSGYARNFLFRNELAEAVTDKTAKKVEILQKNQREVERLREAEILGALKTISETTIEFNATANETGGLFDGVDAKDLSGLIKDQTKMIIPVEYIKLEKPIKKVGDYEVEVAHGGQSAKLKLVIRGKK